MKSLRVDKVNSLLKEVITEAIRKDVKDPRIPTDMLSITQVRVTKDLHQAKVFISLLCEEPLKKEVIKLLNKSSGFIGVKASSKVELRFFPRLTFYLDESAQKGEHIEMLLQKVLPQSQESDEDTYRDSSSF